MKRALAAVVVAAAGASALAQEPVRVEFPLGPVVREGRPVVVRVPGAESVRVEGHPAVSPTGARGDEFVLPRAPAPGGLLTLRIASSKTPVKLPVRVLPADGQVVGRFGPAQDGVVGLPVEGLPTVREAWLWLDRVEGDPPGAGGAELAGLAAWRAGPRSGSRASFEPLLHGPSEDAFSGSVDAGRPAPGLPAAVVRLLVLLAVTEALLAVVTARRQGRSSVHWAGGPALAVALWLVVWGGLPGAVRGTAIVLDGPEDRLVVVRLAAHRAAAAEFEVPAAASWPTLLRFSEDDTSVATAQLGRRVRLRLEPGESRLLAYRLPPAAADDDGIAGLPDGPLARWIGGLGLAVRGPGAPIDASDLPATGGGAVVPALSLRVAPGK